MFNDEQITVVSRVLKSISNPQRLRILCTLLEKDTSVTILADACELSQSALSQHLCILREQHLVSCTRDKKKMIYRISDERIKNVLKIVKDCYCKEEK